MDPSPDKSTVFIGTYSTRGGQGICRAEFDASTGHLSDLQPAFVLPNASYQAIHPRGRFLYSVCEERGEGRRSNGSICALAIEPETGRLRLLNRRRTLGDGPCHICLSTGGQQALISNYASGSVVVFSILADGSLGEPVSFVQHHGGSGVVPDRQEGPHAHSVMLSLDNHYAFAADLGQDRIRVSRFDPGKGTLLPADPPEAVCLPGSGPRHMTMHPGGRHLFLVHELNNTVTVFGYAPESGILTNQQTVSTLPADWKGTSYAADIQVTTDGRFLYASNRGNDSLAIFSINDLGMLETRAFVPVRGRWPRQFRFTPDSRFLLAANQESDTITVFSVDPVGGGLSPVGDSFPVPAPVCLTFSPG
jgi:6-phosphogluconolactonase